MPLRRATLCRSLNAACSYLANDKAGRAFFSNQNSTVFRVIVAHVTNTTRDTQPGAHTTWRTHIQGPFIRNGLWITKPIHGEFLLLFLVPFFFFGGGGGGGCFCCFFFWLFLLLCLFVCVWGSGGGWGEKEGQRQTDRLTV